MDVKDKKILYELCVNSRQPSTIIAKKVRLSREVVEYRIKRLQKQGIIKKFQTLINVDLLGFRSYNVFLLMENFNEEKETEITNYLKNHPAVRWMISCFGKWDIFFRITVKDRQQFDEIFSEISEHLDIRSFEVITNVKKLKAVNPFELFVENTPSKTTKYKQFQKLTEKDLLILKEISNNSRISLIDLSKKISLTPEATKYNIKKLESQGVITGYTCLIDLEKLNYSWYVLLFSLKQMNKDEESALKSLLKFNKKVWFADKNIGRWNLLLELIASDTKDFHKSLIELRNKLGTKLNSFELLLVSKEFLNQSYSELIDKELKIETFINT